jgi:hypothetical protein
MRARPHRPVAVCLASALLTLACGAYGATQAAKAPASPERTFVPPADGGKDYFSTTPQLIDPMRPLAHLSGGRVHVRALVATIPDPVETHLGRSFDMSLSATISAFQSQKYVLDGYAFPWKQVAPDKPKAKDEPYGERVYRKTPGVLLFRRDGWRTGYGESPDYAVVFLVGEAPSYGVQQEAFAVAARCAANYNQADEVAVSDMHLNKPCFEGAEPELETKQDARTIAPTRLDVLGPSFSGSMQSLALAIQALRNEPRFHGIHILLVSASATVGSNANINSLLTEVAEKGVPATDPIVYEPLAWSLDSQLRALRNYLCSRMYRTDLRKVIVLAEESAFGQGAESQLSGPEIHCPDDLTKTIQLDIRSFPPDIASIRAEHSIRRDEDEMEVPGMPKARGRLLELDMTTAREGMERPTVYEPSLSSRSDELMLFRMFDNLRMYVKPDAVVILATDIRDRLFLLNQVRQELPAALPVMMELDFLAIHPDYRKVSRGAIFVPAGDSVVCTDTAGGKLLPCDWRKGQRGRRYSFATDYAANVFRAVSLLLRYHDVKDSRSFSRFSSEELRLADSASPCLYVATLAGFQELTRHGKIRCVPTEGGQSRSSIAAAETRLAAQVPTYLALALVSGYFVILATWVGVRHGQGRIFLSAMRYVVLDGAEIRDLVRRLGAYLAGFLSGRSPKAARERARDDQWLCARSVRVLMVVLCLLAIGTLALSLVGLVGVAGREVVLAHGRDLGALIAIWILYSCACVVGLARLRVSDSRSSAYVARFVKCISRRSPYDPPVFAWVLPVIVAILVLLVIFRQNVPLFGKTPLSVDSGLPWLAALVVLSCGVAFLVNASRVLRLINRVTLFVSTASPDIRDYLGRKDWPAPQSMHQMPQTPFNLSLNRRCDECALAYASPAAWGELTCQIVDHGATSMGRRGHLSASRFEEWEAQLVAELKLYVVTMRTCVWCAMLAPIAVLLAMSTYPPTFEPRLTMVAIVQLVVTFGYAVYLVLRLEQDLLLGPMYTRDGDQLTISGGLRALWPKFLAMGIVLIPLVMPDVWRWLLGIVRSINSFS